MLPAHGYPKLHAYPHLVGNYGAAWQNQQQEFAAFPGPIVMTSNCLIEPRPAYRDRIFTSGPVGWPGLPHVANGDFSRRSRPRWPCRASPTTAPERTITVGFGRDAVLGVADKVIEAVKSGALNHFFLIGGCDGARPGRNYYTEFAEAAPKDSIILTLGCGKVSLLRPRLRDRGRAAAAARSRAMQRLLLGAAHRSGPGRRVQLRRERAAAVSDRLVVRAESRRRAA